MSSDVVVKHCNKFSNRIQRLEACRPVHAVGVEIAGALIADFMVDDDALFSAAINLIAEIGTARPRPAATPIAHVVREPRQRTFKDRRSDLYRYVVLGRNASLTHSHRTCVYVNRVLNLVHFVESAISSSSVYRHFFSSSYLSCLVST